MIQVKADKLPQSVEISYPPNALLPTEEVERVARAICWAFAEETDDCNAACMNARRCMVEKVNPCFERDARAAMRALAKPDELKD